MVSVFNFNECDPMRRGHIEERGMGETTHFMRIWRLKGQASFSRDIKFCPSVLEVEHEWTRSFQELHQNGKVGPGLCLGGRVKMWRGLYGLKHIGF